MSKANTQGDEMSLDEKLTGLTSFVAGVNFLLAFFWAMATDASGMYLISSGIAYFIVKNYNRERYGRRRNPEH